MSGASLSHLLPPLPGLTALARTYAPWPVWTGSTTQPVRFAAMPKKAAVRLWHRARDFDRGTHQPGHHGGAVGHMGLAVLHALIFDFLNHRTGRLDPSYAAIAAKAGVCVRTVASALQRLKALGILNWVRRCAERWADGRFVLEQDTNAYAVLPESQWRGYRTPPEPPGHLGRSAAHAVSGRPGGGAGGRSGGQSARTGRRSEGRPGGCPGTAGAGVHGTKRLILPECTRCGETCPRVKSYLLKRLRPRQSKKGRRIEQEAVGRGCAARRVHGRRGASTGDQRCAVGAAARHGEDPVPGVPLLLRHGRSGSGYDTTLSGLRDVRDTATPAEVIRYGGGSAARGA